MNVAIMQPYFFPYIGYFQLIAAVDLFVVYDNIKYTKKGWINRNRLLLNGKDEVFSLPLKKASDFCNIDERYIAPDFKPEKFLNKLKEAYGKAPYFDPTFILVENIIHHEENNLFGFLHNSIIRICDHVGIRTEIISSSIVPVDHEKRSQDKVIAICKQLHATGYINAIGGLELYSKSTFENQGIDIKFIKSKPFEYCQFKNEFIPSLSIIDVLMFNSVERIRHDILINYDLI